MRRRETIQQAIDRIKKARGVFAPPFVDRDETPPPPATPAAKAIAERQRREGRYMVEFTDGTGPVVSEPGAYASSDEAEAAAVSMYGRARVRGVWALVVGS